MMWASEDLSSALGSRRTRKPDGSLPDVFAFARSACLLAAAATGMDPLDMPYFDFHDDEGLEREAREAADIGFTGKAAIHPAQVPIINRVFVPSDEEVAEANALLAAATEAFARGQAAFVYKGAMVDAPHINRARKIVARANAARPGRADRTRQREWRCGDAPRDAAMRLGLTRALLCRIRARGEAMLDASTRRDWRDGRRHLVAAALLVLLALAMLWWTWGRWPDVLVDFGRELYVPWRLASGDVLYRDVAYLNGPLSAYGARSGSVCSDPSCACWRWPTSR